MCLDVPHASVIKSTPPHDQSRRRHPWCGAGDRVPLEKIVQTRAWENIPAANNHRVFCIRDEYLNTPAPTLVKGLHALAAAIHPECFPHAEGLRCMEQISR